MSTRRNAVIGWLVVKIGARIAKKKARENRLKLGAAGVVGLALASGVVAARNDS
jgi:hypothetical protein